MASLPAVPRKSQAAISSGLSTHSWYSGGRSRYPTYREICTGTTGHAEVVRLTFDPQKVELATLFAGPIAAMSGA